MIVSGHIWKVVAQPRVGEGPTSVLFIIANGIASALHLGQEAASAKELDVIGLLQETECSVDPALGLSMVGASVN